MEQWKDIVGYEGLYQVSNLGNVRSLHYRGQNFVKNLIPKLSNRGYYHIHLRKNGKIKDFTIHRLVAMMFISNLTNLPEVNHINKVKTDNRVENLEWCTRIQNVRHSLPDTSRPRKRTRQNSIIQINDRGDILKIWGNVREIELITKMSAWAIHQCCQGKRKTAYGFKWQFAA